MLEDNRSFREKNQAVPYVDKVELEMLWTLLRQIQRGSNLHFVALATSIGISLIGGGLVLLGKTTEGSVTAAAGLIASTSCAQIEKDSREKLAMLMQRLEHLRSPDED